jgi:hypothetical protein
MRGILIWRHAGGAGRRPAGEDVSFEQPLSKRLCKSLFAPKMRNLARKVFGMYAAPGISRDTLVTIISGLRLDVAIRSRRGGGGTPWAALFAVVVVGVKFDSAKTIPATVFSPSFAPRHVL